MRKKLPRGPVLTVEVTREVMELSRVRDSSHCMVATAIKDMVPRATSISVDLQTIRFSLPEKRLRYTYLTPRQVQLAIIEFDQGEMPEAFSFRLDGAHVTTMHRREAVATPRGPLTPKQQASLLKARGLNPTHMVADHPELAKPLLRARDGSSVPDRVGGRPPPTTPLGRKRAFGLRALQR